MRNNPFLTPSSLSEIEVERANKNMIYDIHTSENTITNSDGAKYLKLPPLSKTGLTFFNEAAFNTDKVRRWNYDSKSQ